MGIDTPSDEFNGIDTNQSGPPMSARHELQPRLLRSNLNTKPNTFPKKPDRQKWTGPIYLLLPLVRNTCNNFLVFFCATHVGHVDFVPELGWRFRSRNL